MKIIINSEDFGEKLNTVLSESVPIDSWADIWKDSGDEVNDVITDVADHTSEELEKITDAANKVEGDVTSSLQSLQSALESYDQEGTISLAQASQLIDAGYQEAISIDQVTGQISINIPMLKQLALAQIEASIGAKQLAYDSLSLAEATSITGKTILAEINVLNAQKSALAGASVDTNSLLAALSNITGASLRSASATGSSTSATNAQKKAYEAEVKSIEKSKDALEDKIDALEDQKDAYNDLIDAKKRSLKLDKEEEDYKSELEDKNKDLADIDNELLQIMNDNSEESNARRLELEKERAEKAEEIAQFQADRTYDIQVDALDAEAEAYEKMIDAQIAGVQAMIDGYDKVIDKINEMIDALSNATSASSGTGVSTAVSAPPKKTYTNPYSIQGKTSPSISTAEVYAKQDLNGNGIVGFDSGGSFETNNGGLIRVHPNEVGAILNTSQQRDAAPLASLFSSIMKNTGYSSTPNNNIGGVGDISMVFNVAGNLDKTVLPDIEKTVTKVLNKALNNRGQFRNASRFSTG
jgi:cell division protein FtsB